MGDNSLPLLIMRDKFTKGLGNLSQLQNIPKLQKLNFSEAMETAWHTDAHFVCYQVNGIKKNVTTRVNKSAYASIKEAGGQLTTQILAFDYDRPAHKPWTKPAMEEWLSNFQSIAASHPILGKWSLLYSTKNGARIVFLLDKPMDVLEAESRHRWLCQQLREAGIKLDDIDQDGYSMSGEKAKVRYPTSDWTRCFRLPFVIRDGDPTWEADLCFWEESFKTRVGSEELGKIEVESAARSIKVEFSESAKPDREWCSSVLMSVAGGKARSSAFFNISRKVLRGTAVFDIVFNGMDLADPGGRHDAMLKVSGVAVNKLYKNMDKFDLLGPEHVYALLVEAAERLEPDSGTPDWTDTLWRHCQYCWAREEAEAKFKQEIKAKKEVEKKSKLQRIVDGMRQWCDDERINSNDMEAKASAMSRLVAVSARSIYVINQDGYYDTLACPHSSLIPRIREMQMDDLIQVKIPTNSAQGYRTASAQEIINEYGTPVCSVMGMPGKDKMHSWIENIGTSSATLVTSIYCRNPKIKAEFNQDIDDWLVAFLGDNFDYICNWIAWSIFFELGPICALSLVSAPGSGKKLFVRGLSELLMVPAVASAQDLIGDFQENLMKTPFLNIDEGWPQGSQRKHPADIFRELTGGGSQWVNQKFRDRIEVKNPVRIILTANNHDVVKGLVRGKELSAEDRDAISIRVSHFNLGSGGAQFLRSKGGLASGFTRGWISGDGGEASQFKIAKHFKWISENRRMPRGTRLLVEGNAEHSLLSTLRVEGGATPIIIEAVVRMLERRKRVEGLQVKNGSVKVLVSSILTFCRQEGSFGRITAAVIHKVLRNIASPDNREDTLDPDQAPDRHKWHDLDVELLLEVARRDGWPCTRIEEIASEARTRRKNA